jgi:hypothetical protein
MRLDMIFYIIHIDFLSCDNIFILSSRRDPFNGILRVILNVARAERRIPILCNMIVI